MISRRPRHVGSGWDDARSWFGGAPQLGRQPWPRGGAQQQPFYFLAQIDFAEVKREIAGREIPSALPDGALAFFIGAGSEEYECTVVHVPHSELGEPTELPVDARAVFEPDGDMFPAKFDDSAPRLFPRWPVDITALEIEPPVVDQDADEDTIREAEDEAEGLAWFAALVKRHLIPRQYFFKADHVYKLIGDVERRFWWHSAHYYLACLRRAVRGPGYVELYQRNLGFARDRLERLRPIDVAGVSMPLGFQSNEPNAELKKAEDEVTRYETQLVEVKKRAVEFERFVSDVASWVPATDPWEPMPPEAVEILVSTFERGRTAFGNYPDFHRPFQFDDLETATLVALATADDRAYATMPEKMRTLINTQYLLPTGSWRHQMFGRGVDIQGNAALENEGNVMLLQLVYDDMLHWDFGDMGAFQFWIPPDDLARANWAAVRLTFECH